MTPSIRMFHWMKVEEKRGICIWKSRVIFKLSWVNWSCVLLCFGLLFQNTTITNGVWLLIVGYIPPSLSKIDAYQWVFLLHGESVDTPSGWHYLKHLHYTSTTRLIVLTMFYILHYPMLGSTRVLKEQFFCIFKKRYADTIK